MTRYRLAEAQYEAMTSTSTQPETADGASELVASHAVPEVTLEVFDQEEDKENHLNPRGFLKSGVSGVDVGRVSVFDNDPFTLDVRSKIGKMTLASCSDGGGGSESDLSYMDFPTVFETPLGPREEPSSPSQRTDDSPLDLTPGRARSISVDAHSRRLPFRPVSQLTNSLDSTPTSVEPRNVSASTRLNRHVMRLPFNRDNPNSPATPFSGGQPNSARSCDDNREIPVLRLTEMEDDDLSNIEREMMEQRNEDMDEQRYENAIKIKELLHRCEAFQDERLLLVQKHETEISSQRLDFQTQQSADKGVIATLQGIIKDQYATIEKLQNDVMSGQSRLVSESSASADELLTSEETPTSSDQPSSVSRLVSALRLERRSLHEDKIRLMTTLESERAEKSSMRQRLDSLTNQMSSPQHPNTPDLEKRLLAEAQCQARDLRARERISKKEIHGLNKRNEDLKKENRKLKATYAESESSSKVMEDRFNESEREKNALKTKLLTAHVEQEMKDKCISKLNKQHRNEVTRLLNENHSLTKQLRDSGATVSALESNLATSEQECQKLVALHLNNQSTIDELTKQSQDGLENPAKGRIPSVSEETILLAKLAKIEIEKENLASVAESLRLRNESVVSDLTTATQQYESARVENDHSRLKIQELEAELESTRQSLIDSELRAEQSLGDAISRTKAESNEEISRLKALISKLHSELVKMRAELKTLSNAYHDFKKETKGLPRWYERTSKFYISQITERLAECQGQLEQLNHRYICELALRKDLHNELITLKGNIRVFCRARPVVDEAETPVISYDPMDEGVVLLDHKSNSHSFSFDRVFRMSATQEEVFSEVCPFITSVVDGYNLCIFAYGQTGAGKTYTMDGPVENPGINRRALSQLFELQKDRAHADWIYETSVSILEIYNENIYDLLSVHPHEKIDGHGATSVPTANVEEVNRVLTRGSRNRAVAETKLNAQSSRSHAIVCVNVQGTNGRTGHKISAKLNLCDLAGSENVGASGATGKRLEEAKKINTSLSALSLVIHGLKAKQPHIAYRNSKLTTILQPSLTGDSKVLMVVQVAPEEAHVTSTKESLRFAERASKVELNNLNLGAPAPSRSRSRTPQKKPPTPKWKK